MIYSDVMTFDYIMSMMLSNVPNDVDKREGSVIYASLAPAAEMFSIIFRELDIIMDETFASTCSRQFLNQRCKERGITPRGASKAVVQAEFTPSTLEIPVGSRFNCGEMNYTVSLKDSAGVYELTAETAGADGNIASGRLLPIVGITGLQTANITEILIPGEDEETTEDLRERFFRIVDSAPYGGNKSDYIEKVGGLDGVGAVKVIPVWNGGGTVKVIILASDNTVPSAELISSVQSEVDPVANSGDGLGIAPIGHRVTVVGAGSTTVNISTTLTYKSGWNWSSAQDAVKEQIQIYFDELVDKWEGSENIIVRISQIESRILDCDAILDISGTTLNGTASNITIASDKIPVFGTISVT